MTGWHGPVSDATAADNTHYFQQRVLGRPSAGFIWQRAAGPACWASPNKSSPTGTVDRTGTAGPSPGETVSAMPARSGLWPRPTRSGATFDEIGSVLATEFELAGLFGVDAIVAGGDGLPYAAQCIILLTKQAGQNETHWANPQWDALWVQLNKTPSESPEYRDIIHQMQAIEYDVGGYIIPGFSNSVDGVAPNVQGLAVQNTKGPLGGPHFERGWLS